MLQPRDDTTNVDRFMPKLTVNGQFIRDFISAHHRALRLDCQRKASAFAASWFSDLRKPFHRKSSAKTSLSIFLLGNANFEVIHFVLEFYNFRICNVLVNPNNPLVQTVLTTIVESCDYFFFAMSPSQSVTTFQSEIAQADLAGLKSSLPRI
jgi:hypothetical protein